MVNSSALRRKEILSFMPTWMGPKGIMLSEISWTEKKTVWCLSLIYATLEKVKLIDQECRRVVARGRGEEE